MTIIHQQHMRLRRELEAPPALRAFGSGWISGTLSVALGLACLGLVFAYRFPGLLASNELLGTIPVGALRLGLVLAFISAFMLAVISLLLRKDAFLGTLGISIALASSIIGGTLDGSWLPNYTPIYFGLDFFILNVIFTGLLFIPLETLFPKHHEQPLFRSEWREDMFYYLVSSMLVQVLSWISLGPAKAMLANTNWDELRNGIAALPITVQVLAIVFLTDLVQYWLHRAFHRIPFLWRFHAVHHSAKSMDWMAGARMHFVEVCILRGTTVLPMILLGFSTTAVYIYIFMVYLWSTFIHANIGWRLRGIDQFLVVPRFHHWHHGIEEEAIDVNFAIHFPWLDRLFGTYHMPEARWPEGYGVANHPVPNGYAAQFMYPFSKSDGVVTSNSTPFVQPANDLGLNNALQGNRDVSPMPNESAKDS